MDFLEGIGDFMKREGVTELEILDGDCLITLRRSAAESHKARRGGGEENLVTSPMQGILRLRPSPEDPPYAAVGDHKKRGHVLFCIEAMKRINEVYAEFDLEVEELLSEDGEAVAQGQAVMRVSEVSA